ncbi:H(+)/Cl(-) exchange transporter ClcA [bacterium BMS3Abin02]|nr:H(+)/Cl(-) exchange transporter ClcA [bacterium BMS3Abin02]HDL49301.1 CBS domain-containing protein [Actinomycetota bacterium]
MVLDRLRLKRAFEQWDTARFLGLAVIVGVLVGAGASLLIAMIMWMRGSVGQIPLGRWVPVLVIPLGILVAWFVSSRWSPEVEGDGVPATIEGLAIRSGYLPSRAVIWKFLVTALTLGTGGSGGREGPIVQIGATIGSSIARHTNLGEDQVRSLVAAGAGAAIGASFNAPIAGMLFAMEVILRTLSIRHLSAVVVASVAAAVTTRSISGGEEILRAQAYGLIPHREWQELLIYAALGIAIAVLAWAFLRLLGWTEELSERFTRWPWLRPLAFGLVIALIGVVEPDVLGTGQDFVARIVNISVSGTQVWWLLMVLAALKIVTTSATISSGGSGGAFMPSLFIGAAFGAGLAELLAPAWTLSPLRPGPFAVVGMAAMFAAVARAPLTSILIVFEITQDYKLLLPLMLAVSLATLIADVLSPESVYTMPLIRKGIQLVHASEVDVLDTIMIGDVMSGQSPVAPHMTLKEAMEILNEHGHHGAAVLDNGRLVGVLSISDILRQQSTGLVADAMTPRPVTVTANTPVSRALERMAALGVSRLPVVAEDDPTRLVGMFRREDIVKAYHVALGSATGVQLARDRLRRKTEPGVSFFEIQVPEELSGQLLKDVSWPDDCTIVSVRRRTTVYVPRGDTRLEAGDVITVFGTNTARDELVARMGHTGVAGSAGIE